MFLKYRDLQFLDSRCENIMRSPLSRDFGNLTLQKESSEKTDL